MSKNLMKLIVILVVAVTLIVGSVYLLTRRPQAAYQFDTVQTGNIAETVKVSGAIKAAESINLSFERSGKIAQKNVSVGDKVTAGQVLLTIDSADAAATLAQAQAALDKQIAGNRPEYLAQLQAAVDQADASLNQVKAVSDNSLHAAESVKLTAENNLKLAQGGESSRIVEDAYENSSAILQSVQNSLTNALTKADNILGVDNIAANEMFRNNLAVKDSTLLASAKSKYALAKASQQDFADANSALVPTDHVRVETAIISAGQALASTRDLLTAVTGVLNASVAGSDLSLSDLDTLKTIIQTTQIDISAKVSALTDSKHALAVAKNSYTTYQIAADNANQNLGDITKKTAADVASAQAALDRAKAVLADAKNPPRAVDLAGARAAVYAASVSYDKTVLKAPFDGTVSRQDGELGALAAAGVPLVSVISNNQYQVEIYVAETDLSKIKVGDSAAITLDNLEGNIEFPAQVIKIDPAATISPTGISAYKVTLQFNHEDERLKVGLTANVKIVGASKDNALTISARDVVQKNGQYFVMVVNSNSALEQKPVEIGLKGENDLWEIVSGLQAGDAVVSFSSLK